MWFVFAVLTGPLGSSSEFREEEIQHWVCCARSGDSSAAGRLYSALAARVFRAVRPLCQSETEAEDVVQDAFVKGFGSLENYEPRPGTRFAAWLITIALNDARKRGARNQRRLELVRQASKACIEDAAETPEEALDLARRKRQLLEALQELTDRDREVVSLRYGAGLGAEEVAMACGTSAANVRKICEGQRRRLLGLLQDQASAERTMSAEVQNEPAS